jgi:GH15 family glucan-1,4-alpha-glucosidase
MLAMLVGALAAPLESRAQPPVGSCSDASEPTPEKYGPTDISAVTGNQQLSVALNPDATVTVLKWPSPSYYDQIKYRTTDRAERFSGALPNEGSFLGIAWRTRGSTRWTFDWLRQWRSGQHFESDDGDIVVTTFDKASAGLSVAVRDVVAPDTDVLVRSVTIGRSKRSAVTTARVISFTNFNPVVSKNAQDPTADWCREEDNDLGASYDKDADAIVAERSGTDSSTGEPSSVALAMGFDGSSSGHDVGVDTYETAGTGTSAYDDAGDARLAGDTEATGQTDAALSDDLSLRRHRKASTTILFAAARSTKEVLGFLSSARGRSAAEVTKAKDRWWRRWLKPTALPRGGTSQTTRLAKRALISIRQATDVGSGLIVASIATQAPYGLDWVRNGAYVNHALDLAGHPEMVRKHDLAYAQLQITAANPNPGQPAPPGNWSQNFYADGVVGGPIPYEIDETGLGIWTLWDHYAHTEDRDYLMSRDVYEAIQRAAQYLSDPPPSGCIDPTTGLQCVANEGDDTSPRQTLEGAEAVWLGLDAAVKAAKVRNTEQSLVNAAKWAARRDQLGDAIEANFYNEECNCYTQDYKVGGTLLWPVGYLDDRPARARAQALANWLPIRSAIDGRRVEGGLEAKALLGNSYAWAGSVNTQLVEKGLEWVADVPTTARTELLGEAWMHYPKERDPIVTMVSQADVPSQAMFYLAALKTYGRRPYR